MFGGVISQQMLRCREAFKKFAYEQAPVQQIQEVLQGNEIEHFIDIEFPPIMASIYNPNEQFPFDEEIVWKRAKDFLMPTDRHRPDIFPN